MNCATASGWFRRRYVSLLTLGVMAALGTLLLVACGDPLQPAQASGDQTPRVQQPALRPRAATATPLTLPEASPPAPSDPPAAPETPAFIQVATGENHTCALRRDGAVECWGANDHGQLDVPKDLRFQQITSGWHFSCGIQTDRRITCWGRNNHQQVDPPEGQFTSVDAGWDHACALRGTAASCWGRNANDRATPPTGAAFTAIGAGAEHSCGLSTSGGLVCWGKNDNGRADSRDGPFRALAVGIAHTCVLESNGTALCQGENAAGQSEPPGTAFTHMNAGFDHTCGLLATGHLECWGANPSGSGNIAFAPPGQYSSVSAGWETGCGINTVAHVICWPSTHRELQPDLYGRSHMTIVAPGFLFSNPTEVLPWPSGGLAIAERSGLIISLTPELDVEPILDLTSAVDPDGGEKGLLSIAVDPQFQDYKFIYVYYTLHNGNEPSTAFARLSRFPVVNGIVAHDTELVILDIPRSTKSKVHWGGAIRFGPDGMLYLGIGDSSCLECPQDLTTLHGKIIRIDIRESSPDQPYRVPDDNPFVGVPKARSEIWAYGLRNPWRMSFDSQDGLLWVGDVGDRFVEEATIATSGANLGWPILEGLLCFNADEFTLLNEYASERHSITAEDPCKDVGQFTAPIISYPHDGHVGNGNCAIVGGIVYRGIAIPWLDGTYLFGDFCSGRVWALNGDAVTGWHMLQIADLNTLISSFGVDADGELLVLTFGGPILRLVDAEVGFAPSVTHVPVATTLTTPSIAAVSPETRG